MASPENSDAAIYARLRLRLRRGSLPLRVRPGNPDKPACQDEVRRGPSRGERRLEAVGIEPTADLLFHKDLQQSIAKKAESHAPVSPPSGADMPPDLDHVVSAWPSLPEHIKAAVVTLVKAAGVQP